MNNNYGLLLNQTAKIHRQYFNEMVRLLGIQVIYRAPKPGKKWTTYREFDNNFEIPQVVGCIFDDHPTQKTMKKLGWISELQDQASIISVPYNLRNIQVGGMFVIPSAIDGAQGRLFRVVEMSTIMIYPSSISCMIVPEYEDNLDEEVVYDFSHSSLNLLNEEEDFL